MEAPALYYQLNTGLGVQQLVEHLHWASLRTISAAAGQVRKRRAMRRMSQVADILNALAKCFSLYAPFPQVHDLWCWKTF